MEKCTKILRSLVYNFAHWVFLFPYYQYGALWTLVSLSSSKTTIFMNVTFHCFILRSMFKCLPQVLNNVAQFTLIEWLFKYEIISSIFTTLEEWCCQIGLLLPPMGPPRPLVACCFYVFMIYAIRLMWLCLV
jgi:hypothetical protein